MAKSREAFRTIAEVADWLGLPAHVLRFWESKFTQIRPVKGAGGRRYYRPQDMALIGGIKTLLHDQGMTIKGAQKLLREKGIKHVAAISPPLDSALSPKTRAKPMPAEAPPPNAQTPPKATAKMQFNLFPDDKTIPADPADADSFADARILASLYVLRPETLRENAQRIAPLVEKLASVYK